MIRSNGEPLAIELSHGSADGPFKAKIPAMGWVQFRNTADPVGSGKDHRETAALADRIL